MHVRDKCQGTSLLVPKNYHLGFVILSEAPLKML